MENSALVEAIGGLDQAVIITMVIAIAAVAITGLLVAGRRRTQSALLAERFGAEYGRTVDATRSRRRAEFALAERAERRRSYELHGIDPDKAAAFRRRWEELQASFIDGPAFAAATAHDLVAETAVARGYSNSGIQECMDDVSVDHPELVADLRRSRAEARRWPTTEHHRETVVHARALFERLMTAPSEPGVSDINADRGADAGTGGDINQAQQAGSAGEVDGDNDGSDRRERDDELAEV